MDRGSQSMCGRGKLRPFLFGCAFIAACALLHCGEQPTETDTLEVHGEGLGTTYTIRVARFENANADLIRRTADETIAAINDSMSGWQDDSELSRFNASRTTDRFVISEDFANVVRRAQGVYAKTNGAFDPTRANLFELWGFGPAFDSANPPEAEPTREAIQDALAVGGFDRLTLHGTSIRKSHPELTIDVSAIAKGYAVDRVFQDLKDLGYEHIMVEIGGEVRVGAGPPGRKWQIAIEKPNYDTGRRELHRIVALEQLSMATSGDYRTYYQIDGQRYGHVLDPRTGRPAGSGAFSATVVGPDCTEADAWATALLVLGKAGIEMIEGTEYDAYLIMAGDGTEPVIEMTAGFSSHLVEEHQH